MSMSSLRTSRFKRAALAFATLVATSVAAVFVASPASAVAMAFPGAEGYGTDTAGGRGGSVCQVTNLNDSGTGSLRACVAASGPRVVIFRTGGTINLNSRITVTNPDITILGHTAPGDGITLKMADNATTDQGTLQVETHDVVIRYLRFRPGNPGNADDSHDGVQIYKAGVEDVVVDHSSVSWAVDENVNTYDYSNNITVSWSIISEALSNSTHPDGEHSKGMLSGGVDAHNVSIHHNLFVSNRDRNPQISGVSVADVRNNVLYNYGDGSGDGTTLISSSKGVPQVNIVNNYYKKGPSSPANYPDWALYSGDNGCVHGVYVSGNKHNESGSTVTNATRGDGCNSISPVGSAYTAPAVTTTSAEQAYLDVLASAGASKVRDAVDTRIIDEVTNRTGSFKNSSPGWPTLATGTAPTDSDGDGLPDSWENSGGGTTPSGDEDADGYSNIEEWAESLLPGGSNPPSNTAPTVNAGADDTVTMPAAASLDGTVTDDGLPESGTLTRSWSKTSGPGTVTFSNQSSDDTQATFSAAGTYVLRLTASDGSLTSNDEVTITVNAASGQNQAPIVNAGADQNIQLPSGATLDATVSDDGLPNPPADVTTTWSKASGPGTVTFADASAVDTTASFSAAGTYVLNLNANDGSLSTNDTLTVTVAEESAQNQAPTVNAGADTSVQRPNGVVLDGTVTDDGLNQPLAYTWSQVSGPGTTTFGSTSTVDTVATFSEAGTYVLELEAYDGEFTVADTLTVTVTDPSAGGPLFAVSTEYGHSTTSSVTVDMPPNVQTGDKVIMQVIENKGTGGVIASPSGVTALASEVDDGSSIGTRIYVHTVSGSSPSSFTFSGSAFSQMAVAAVAYRGASTIKVIDQDPDTSTVNATHPVSGDTTAHALNVVMAADRVYESGAQPSTWTLDSRLTELMEGYGPKSGSAFSSVIGDTQTPVPAEHYHYEATASQASGYAITALIQILGSGC